MSCPADIPEFPVAADSVQGIFAVEMLLMPEVVSVLTYIRKRAKEIGVLAGMPPKSNSRSPCELPLLTLRVGRLPKLLPFPSMM